MGAPGSHLGGWLSPMLFKMEGRSIFPLLNGCWWFPLSNRIKRSKSFKWPNCFLAPSPPTTLLLISPLRHTSTLAIPQSPRRITPGSLFSKMSYQTIPCPDRYLCTSLPSLASSCSDVCNQRGLPLPCRPLAWSQSTN